MLNNPNIIGASTSMSHDHNYMYNMLIITLLSTLITSLVNILTELNKTLIKHLGTVVTNVFEYFKKLFRNKKNEIIIEHKINNSEPKLNNKLLIDAILHDYLKGNNYKLTNKELLSETFNDYEREKSRELFLSINDTFIQDDIVIKYELTTKKIKIKDKENSLGDIDNSQVIEETIPEVEKLFLSSNKSIDHIKNYILNKRDKYIEKFCSKDNHIYIYPVNTYGATFLEFSKLKFASRKGFDSWFSPHKPKITKIIEDFKNKKGIYSLSSVPYKMGILLYGEPGCGKTSFIKSLANELDRCIIPIFLDKFTSAASFKTLFQSEYICVKDNNYFKWTYLPMHKRLIVFEEIDTAGCIVMDREKLKFMVKNRKIESLNKKIFDKFIKSYDYCKNKSDSEDEPDIISIPKKNLSGHTGINANHNNSIDRDRDKNKKNKNKKRKPFDNDIFNEEIFDKSLEHKSNICLGDILDALDGICEATGLVYVMTTNHIDFLDSALIRPGRITYAAELGVMNYPEIKEMLIYYYVTNDSHSEKLDKERKIMLIEEIAKYFDDKFKPSKIEEICKNYSLEELFCNMNTI